MEGTGYIVLDIEDGMVAYLIEGGADGDVLQLLFGSAPKEAKSFLSGLFFGATLGAAAVAISLAAIFTFWWIVALIAFTAALYFAFVQNNNTPDEVKPCFLISASFGFILFPVVFTSTAGSVAAYPIIGTLVLNVISSFEALKKCI